MLEWLVNNWLNALNVLGVVVGLWGLWLTYWQARQARKAAQTANDAVTQVKKQISQISAIETLSTAITMFEEIKRLQRLENWYPDAPRLETWRVLPERYSQLRKLLIEIRASHPAFDVEEQQRLARAATQCRLCEEAVELAIVQVDPTATPQSLRQLHPDWLRLNKRLTTEQEKLEQILARTKTTTGV
jgi:hypothetical protein